MIEQLNENENLSHKLINETIGAYLDVYLPDTDCQPLGQRPPIKEDVQNKKNEGITNSIW